MPELQEARIRFAGLPVERIQGAVFTLSRGISPSVAQVRVSPGHVPPMVGSLELGLGNTLLVFRDCAVFHAPLRHWLDRTVEHEVSVYDRRWKWRYGEISGDWNTRACNGEIHEGRKKNLRELAELCLAAMNEPTSAAVQLPSDMYPEVAWNKANPARELAWLCELAGFIPGLDADDQTRIWALGDGGELELGERDAVDHYRHKPTVLPSAVRVEAAPTVFQAWMELEAVGLDIDGVVKLIDDLSYKPTGGWGREWWHAFPDVDPFARHLAFQTVWRWYRIKGRVGGGWAFGDVAANVTGLDQILPLRETLVEAVPSDTGRLVCQRPIVRGVFWPLCDHRINTGAAARWNGSWKLLPDQGIVEFEYPVFKWGGSTGIEETHNTPEPAELQVLVAFGIRDEFGVPVARGAEQMVPGATATEPRVERRPDLHGVRVYDTGVWGGAAGDNYAALDAELNAQATRLVATYGWDYAMTVVRGGIEKIHPDGAIAQVQWQLGSRLMPLTTVGYNAEFDLFSKPYQQRRREERLGRIGGVLWS